MSSSATAANQSALGHFVRVYDPQADLGLSFPPIIIKGLALELAEMLREVMQGKELSVVSYSITGKQIPEAEAATERTKRRLIDAREAENPGAAFLDSISYWPFGKPEQE